MRHHNESMIIVQKSTGKAVFEFFSKKIWARVNLEKFDVVPASEYLAKLNQTIASEVA